MPLAAADGRRRAGGRRRRDRLDVARARSRGPTRSRASSCAAGVRAGRRVAMVAAPSAGGRRGPPRDRAGRRRGGAARPGLTADASWPWRARSSTRPGHPRPGTRRRRRGRSAAPMRSLDEVTGRRSRPTATSPRRRCRARAGPRRTRRHRPDLGDDRPAEGGRPLDGRAGGQRRGVAGGPPAGDRLAPRRRAGACRRAGHRLARGPVGRAARRPGPPGPRGDPGRAGRRLHIRATSRSSRRRSRACSISAATLRPPSTLRAVPLGGGPIPPGLVERAHRGRLAGRADLRPDRGRLGGDRPRRPPRRRPIPPAPAGRCPASALRIGDPDDDGIGEIQVVDSPALFSELSRRPGRDRRGRDRRRLAADRRPRPARRRAAG